MLLAIVVGASGWFAYEKAVDSVAREWKRQFGRMVGQLGRLRVEVASVDAANLGDLFSVGQVARRLRVLNDMEGAATRLLRVVEQPRSLADSSCWFDFVIEAGVERAIPVDGVEVYAKFLRAEAELCWHTQRAIELVRDHWGRVWWEDAGFCFAEDADDSLKRAARRLEVQVIEATEGYARAREEARRVRALAKAR